MNKNNIKEKIFLRVLCDIKTKCWEWKGAKSGGYGNFVINGKQMRAHRLSYQIFIGELRPKFQINHMCSNRSCINPEHLEQITHAENGSREKANHYNARLTHCKRGHEFNETNTRYSIRPNGHNGWKLRQCKICRKITSANYRKGLSPKRPELKERFMQKIEKRDNGCWEWIASKHLGYGKFKYKGEMRLAHRVSYEIFIKKIPLGLVVDHICYNKGCVNPDHLQLLTLKENSSRGGKRLDN